MTDRPKWWVYTNHPAKVKIKELESVVVALMEARSSYPAMTQKYGKWIPVDEALKKAGYVL